MLTSILRPLASAATRLASTGFAGFLLAAACATLAAAQDEITFSGGGSVSYGRIMKSSDTTSVDYNGNFIRSVGAQFLMKAKFGENLQLTAGMGAIERHFMAGRITNTGGRNPYVMAPYLVNASIAYSWWEDDDRTLKLTGGYFPYSYNPDVKNLGLYLLRGPVYPGILISGFETKHTGPVANQLGIRLQHAVGGFEQNLLINSETELYPLFDISPAYLASYRFGKAFRIGAGVNFYHLVPMEKKLTSPDTLTYDDPTSPAPTPGDPNSRVWIYVDSATGKHTFMSFAGTKVMANASLDPKAFFGNPSHFGPADLLLYGEVALLGLENDKAHKDLYGPYSERMPLMVGFNFPMFKFLDHLSVEVEIYKSKVLDDLARYQASTSNPISPLPKPNSSNLDVTKDDLKWSIHGSRKFGPVRLAFQAANDHTRPGGQLNSPANEWQAIMAAPTDWYFMTKLAFSF